VVEPFVGSGAVTIACAYTRRARKFLINDIHRPLMQLWDAIILDPEKLADKYESLWTEQEGQVREYYDRVRERFNKTHEPHCFLYLLARCVKAAVRYNGKGEFNNSPDNRRLGMLPETMRRNLVYTSQLLKGRTTTACGDYRQVLAQASEDDLVYMDPPYQGVSEVRDHRYVSGVDFDEFVEALADLNRRHVPFIVSYDGRTGVKVHGRPLPGKLRLSHHEIAVGRSTQSTLLGRDHDTVESLYLSPALVRKLDGVPSALRESEPATLFEAV
jgi:DNA adenine methylase